MKTSHQFVPWSEVRSSELNFLKPVINQWQKIIAAEKTKEERVHSFLAKHPRLFLWGGIGFATVISKLRFGAEFVSDFVTVYDNWSNGIKYTLTEIERPETSPFTKDGVASARLSRAIQQVLCWKSWLSEHTTEARRLFPSLMFRTGASPIFEFEIIIGTRKNTEPWVDRRLALSAALGIAIRSFDSLTDRARNVHIHDISRVGDEIHNFDLDSLNQLACPFVRALSDSDWRAMVREEKATSHFMHGFGKQLLQRQQENELANKFRRLQLKNK